jgi:hypothetical protein
VRAWLSIVGGNRGLYVRRRDGGSRPWLAVVTLAVLVAALLAGAAAALLVGVPALPYAAKWAGTPGVFAVRSCAEVGAPKERHMECVGTFRSDDGGTVDTDAEISWPLAVGAAVAVQRTPGDSYVQVGVAAFWGWLAVALFGAVLAGAAVMVALVTTGRNLPRAVWKACFCAIGLALAAALTGAIAGAVT